MPLVRIDVRKGKDPAYRQHHRCVAGSKAFAFITVAFLAWNIFDDEQTAFDQP